MPKDNSKPASEAEKVEDAIPPQGENDDAPGAGPNELGAIEEPTIDPVEAEPEQSVEDACAELGIKPDADGNVEIELLTSLAGANVKARGELHGCGAAEAVRMIRAGFAKIRG